MNYIELIRTFWRLHEEHSFSTAEIALYLYLVEVSNICRWKNPFKRNNAKIQADLNISYNILKNARNKLQQAGLITYQTRNGSPNVTYILAQPESGYMKNNEVDDEVTVQESAQPAPTKYKQNKTQTKLNNKREYPFQEIAEMWNTLCPLQPKIKKITRGREEKIRKRLDEIGGCAAEWTITLRQAFEKISQSTFMQGENKNGWRATFDWVFENDKNIIKILEGNYDNRNSHFTSDRTNRTTTRADERKRELDHLENLCEAVLQCDIPPQY
ncbi:hypothetical protein LJB95_02685 [Paludibacteraceae bacterium OttesenSCG-928-F17]|nr:hypothetical protein [Paludibacteraceae bacterium OttesenSCG-928-F17]